MCNINIKPENGSVYSIIFGSFTLDNLRNIY